MARRSGTLRFKILLAVALLFVVAWSVLWFVAATVVDRQAERVEMQAEARGTILNCAHRSVKGFPFRIELRCGSGTKVANRGGSVQVEGLTVAALIYNPRLIIAEVHSPAVVEPAGAPRIRAEWDLAHASTRLDFSDRAVERLDAELRGTTITVGESAPVTAREVHFNVRQQPDEPDDVDVAGRVVGLVPMAGGEPVDLAFRGEVPGGAPLLAGRPEVVLASVIRSGLPLTIDSATVSSGTMTVAVAGTLTMKPNGKLDGDLEVAIAGSEDELPYVKVVAPDAANTLESLLHNVLAYAPETTIGDQKAKKLTLTIREGRVSAGFVPLFTLPPVALAGR